MDLKNRILAVFLGAVIIAVPGVKVLEGEVLTTYADPVGIPTICYGHTGADVVKGRVASRAECETLLVTDLIGFAKGLAGCVRVVVRPNEAAAMLSWAYNVGIGNACTSTLVRMVNTGAPAKQWCAQLDRWIWATTIFGIKVRLPGLINRRVKERAMCERGVPWAV